MKILRIVPQNMRISQLRRPNIEDGLANFEDLTLIFEEKLKTASCAGSPYQDTHYTINKIFLYYSVSILSCLLILPGQTTSGWL